MKIDRREIRDLAVCICRKFAIHPLCPKHRMGIEHWPNHSPKIPKEDR